MVITNYTDFRQKLKSYLDAVLDSRTPLFVTRKKGESLVVLPQGEYDGMLETYHLLKSSVNAERLNKALSEFNDKL